MVQTFEVFLGLPSDLKIKLDTLKAGGATIVQVVTTDVAATYLIIHQQ